MTTPISTPGAPQPITTPPENMVASLRELMPYLSRLASLDEARNNPGVQALTAGSADFMRKLFPHLDDLTLAAMCGYVATNLVSLVQQDALCPDSLRVALVYADMAKALAWSLNAPDGVEPQ